MSYYTEVRVYFQSDDDSVTAEMLIAEAKVFLSGFGFYAVDDIIENFTTGIQKGHTSFNDLRSSDLTELFRALSRKYPKVELNIWGHGEEFGDVWVRRCLGGKVTIKRGPFEF